MTWRSINRFNGQLSIEYSGLNDAEIYAESYYLMDNGFSSKWAAEKRPGTKFIAPTLDGGPSKLIDTANKTLIINPSGVLKYDKKTGSLDSVIVSDSSGNRISLISVTGDAFEFSGDPAGLSVGDYIIVGKKDVYKILDKGVKSIRVEPLFGKAMGILHSDFEKLSVSVSPWTIYQIDSIDFAYGKPGIVAVHPDVPPKIISPDGDITDLNPTGNLPSNPISATVFANRLFFLLNNGGTPSVWVSRVASFSDFVPAANDAASPIIIDMMFMRPEDMRWIGKTSMGVVIGGNEGLYFLRNKAGIGIFDATIPTYAREISDIGAFKTFPMLHNDSLYYVAEDGTGIAVVQPAPYYEETNVKVSRVSDYSDVFNGSEGIVKMTRTARDKHFIYCLTKEGYIGVARPVSGEASTSLFMSTWSVGHFQSMFIDAERMRYEDGRDRLMFCVKRGMQSDMKYFIEIMEFSPKFRKPEYYADYYAVTEKRMEGYYDEYVTELLKKSLWLDACVIYKAGEGKIPTELKVFNGSFITTHDYFEDRMVGWTIRTKDGVIATISDVIDPRLALFFNNGQLDGDDDLIGWSFVTDRIEAAHLYDEDTHSLIAIADGKFHHAERHHPCAIDTDYIAPYKFKRIGGYIYPGTLASEFIIGIPYRFSYVTNPIVSDQNQRTPPMAMIQVTCSMSGDFMIATTDGDYKFIEHEARPLAHPSYYYAVKECSILSESADPYPKIHIIQESGYPLMINRVKIKLNY